MKLVEHWSFLFTSHCREFLFLGSANFLGGWFFITEHVLGWFIVYSWQLLAFTEMSYQNVEFTILNGKVTIVQGHYMENGT